MNINSPVARLKGVGPIMEKALHSVGITRIGELLNYYPRRWETYQSIKSISSISPGLVSFEAKVERVAMRRSHRHKRLTITEAILTDNTGTVRAIWFNQPYLTQTLVAGKHFRFRGNYEYKNGYISLQSPSIEKPSMANIGQEVLPIYPETKQLTSAMIRKLIAQCQEVFTEISNVLPDEIVKSHGLMDKSRAVLTLHMADSLESLELAKRTISFEELLELVLAGLVIKKNIKEFSAHPIKYSPEVAQEFVAKLPFDMTSAQKKSAHTILEDLDNTKPMNRLLEGDVGSGKTLVALMACVMVARAGQQSAIMVPTEILARQHFNSTLDLLNSLGITSALLISDMKKPDRTKVLEDLKSGKVDCIIGTHALISKDVEYKDLGLVVVDEQHRFGVNQRKELKAKAGKMPHLLTMTATPIPRSLALVVYGDLDVSVIDELPKGRKPIQTKLVEDKDRVHVYAHIDSLIGQGQQAYVVCPMISESDKLGVKSVETEYKNLQNSVFKHRRIGLVHGRLKADEKADIMNQFKLGKLDMLVATSVIEVGVDVPNATIMLIEGADRFGLAALHQLRGRVGRGDKQSHCYLFTSSDNPDTIKRLRALEKTTDGFRLAQIDLETRGPGEIYGTAQHGLLDLRLADLFDHVLINEVKEAAEALLNKHNLLEYKQLSRRVNQLTAITSLD
jgi:ATP-dependent DNA helicase RecG